MMVNAKILSGHFVMALSPKDKYLKYSRGLVEVGVEFKAGQHSTEFYLTHV